MYRETYSEIAVEDQTLARRREYDALNRVIAMLEQAAKSDRANGAVFEAIDKMEALWTIFIDDLSDTENGLPEDLRAKLISIGLFIVKSANEARSGGKVDLKGLIEINAAIRDGLK